MFRIGNCKIYCWSRSTDSNFDFIAETLETIYEYEAHDWYVHCVVFSPDGTRLVSTCGDGTIRLWDSRPITERRTATASARRAREAIRGRVVELLESDLSLEAAAETLRNDTSLSEDERTAALFELLRLATAEPAQPNSSSSDEGIRTRSLSSPR